jgi:hypothetical protein
MPQPAINNPSIVIEAPAQENETRTARRKRLKAAAETDPEVRGEMLRRQVAHIREKIVRLACSAAWAEDCLYRGTDYAPDFRCRCGLCEVKYPERRYPRQARESNFSVDCQVEADEDPELAEDLARLRNDRLRVGSVFLAMSFQDRGSETRRKKRHRRQRRRRPHAIRGDVL